MSHFTDPQYLPQTRSVWGRCLALAALLHLSAGALLVSNYAGLRSDALATLEPMLHSRVVEPAQDAQAQTSSQIPDAEDNAIADVQGSLPQPIPAQAVAADSAAEPGFDYVKRAAQRIVQAINSPQAVVSLDDLERKAKVLQQISTPNEVARIAEGVIHALGAASPTTTPPADGPFDYDRCVVVTAERIEREGVIEIRETLRDRSGRTVVIAYERRRDSQSGAFAYFQSQWEHGARTGTFPIDARDFADAEARQRPYDLINRFSLMKQLHEQAVLPLLDKFGQDHP